MTQSQYFYKIPENIEFIRSEMLLKGPLGSLSIKHLNRGILKIENNYIFLKSKKFLGIKKILKNKIKGLLFGFKIELNLTGIGYKALLTDKNLILNLGYSHPISIKIPETIQVFIENEKNFILYGINYEELTNFSSKIIKLRPINCFTGHGIKLKQSIVTLKKNKKK